jgi:hypothetical protein
VTKKGKTLRGTIRTDLTRDEAKAIDPFTFRKGDGWFVREGAEAKSGAETPTARITAPEVQRRDGVGYNEAARRADAENAAAAKAAQDQENLNQAIWTDIGLN